MEQNGVTICVLGASFDTGNLGVSALAESTIKIILNRWPAARVILLGNAYDPEDFSIPLKGREVMLSSIPVRFSPRLSLPYHFLWYLVYRFLAAIVPGGESKQKLIRRNRYCEAIYNSTVAVDITGGDSFSDLYGIRRFVLGFLRKWLVLFYGKRLVMLPQTYGPFERRITKVLARHILRRSETIYSRDQEGIDYLRRFLNPTAMNKVRFSPDVAFVLDPRKPAHLQIEPHAHLRACCRIVIGLNVSGLLHNRLQTEDNRFRLKADYRRLVRSIAESFLEHPEIAVLIIPHVFPEPSMPLQSDTPACRQLFDDLKGRFGGRVFLAGGHYNQNEVKHLIGLCEFFIGSRMHACIAALSQAIPAVGLAYSKKFQGVFESVGMGPLVVDLRQCDEREVLSAVKHAFEFRQTNASKLRVRIPMVQKQILGMFDGW